MLLMLPCRPAAAKLKVMSRGCRAGKWAFSAHHTVCVDGRFACSIFHQTCVGTGGTAQARDVLMDPAKRAEYEEELRAARTAAAAGPSADEPQQQSWAEGGGRGGRQQHAQEEWQDHMPCECATSPSHAAPHLSGSRGSRVEPA